MQISRETKKELIRKALEVRERAYAPYSGFQVGAALLGKHGTVFLGCNVENAAYTPTNCGERTAFFQAIAQGEREFSAIAIVGGAAGSVSGERDYCAPCGVCRQVMMEFCDPEEFLVILARDEEDFLEYRLSQLLPMGFGPDSLKKKTYPADSRKSTGEG